MQCAATASSTRAVRDEGSMWGASQRRCPAREGLAARRCSNASQAEAGTNATRAAMQCQGK